MYIAPMCQVQLAIPAKSPPGGPHPPTFLPSSNTPAYKLLPPIKMSRKACCCCSPFASPAKQEPPPAADAAPPTAHQHLPASFAFTPLPRNQRPVEVVITREQQPAVDASGRAPAPPDHHHDRAMDGRIRTGGSKAAAFSSARGPAGFPPPPPAEKRRARALARRGSVVSGDTGPAGIGGSYLGVEAAALLACVTATLLVLPLLLPPLPPPPPLFLLVPVAIFAVLVLLVLVPSDAKCAVVSTAPPYSSSSSSSYS